MNKIIKRIVSYINKPVIEEIKIKEKELIKKEFDLNQSKLLLVKALEDLNNRINDTIKILKK
jgi:hypothetical protein